MEMWEHKFVMFTPGRKNEESINEMLAERDAEGWQLVHFATPHAGNVWSFAFKRARQV